MSGDRTALLDLLADVKTRAMKIQETEGGVSAGSFPIPQFVILGKQSVGKSRLIETLAGECFNFVSGTLGSRRPTVLEFRNVPGMTQSVWQVPDPTTNMWTKHTTAQVMEIVGRAHESLGRSVSTIPISVRLESANCADMGVVDLPGFRSYGADDGARKLADDIEKLNERYMQDSRNVMICVEEAGDSSTYAILGKCKKVDPAGRRTILVRNKLDKYYQDLTPANVDTWLDGDGNLPKALPKFCMTLPFWREGEDKSAQIQQMRKSLGEQDQQKLQQEKKCSKSHYNQIGFQKFQIYMENRTEQMYGEAVGPVLAKITEAKQANERIIEALDADIAANDPTMVLHTIRDAGMVFAQAVKHVMEGFLMSEVKRVDMRSEMQAFADEHRGSAEFDLTPHEGFQTTEEYIRFLQDVAQIPAFGVEVNGGAQFLRLKVELETFFRFCEIKVDVSEKEVINMRGVTGYGHVHWGDVIAKLVAAKGNDSMTKVVGYIAERLRFFFATQKDVILDFMHNVHGAPDEHMYSQLFPQRAQLISSNPMMKELIYTCYDKVLQRQKAEFVDIMQSTLDSTWKSPMQMVKAATMGHFTADMIDSMMIPSLDDTKERVQSEWLRRAKPKQILDQIAREVPDDPARTRDAAEQISSLVLKVFALIRSLTADQMELFAVAFFQLPMMNRLEEDMASLTLSEEHMRRYQVRRDENIKKRQQHQDSLREMDWCIKEIEKFQMGAANATKRH